MRRERFSARPPRGLDQDGAPGRAVSLAHNPLYGSLAPDRPRTPRILTRRRPSTNLEHCMGSRNLPNPRSPNRLRRTGPA